MKIYDPVAKRTLKEVILYLTPQEAGELGDSASDLSEHPEHHHHHINDAGHEAEITVAVFTADNTQSFDLESCRIITGKGLKARDT